MTEQFKPERDGAGRFLPGHSGAKKRGTKRRITERMLIQFSDLEEKGGTTPFKLWEDVLSGKYDGDFERMTADKAWTIRLKAAECMAKYVYDASYDTEEAESVSMSVEQIEALKAAFPQFKKGE